MKCERCGKDLDAKLCKNCRCIIPNNEFTEICTADMKSADSMWHGWMQDKWIEARKWWENKLKEKYE